MIPTVTLAAVLAVGCDDDQTVLQPEDAAADAGGSAPDAEPDAGRADAGDGAPDADAGAPPDADAGGGAPDADTDWSCVGHVEPATPAIAVSTVRLSFIAANGFVFDGGNPPLALAGVEACAGRDPACSSKVASAVTSPGGEVELQVPTGGIGFTGFFRITAAGSVPTLLFQNPPIAHEGVPWHGPWIAPTGADLATYASRASVTLDPGRGRLLVLTANCHYLDHDPFQPSGTRELAVTAGGRPPDLDDTILEASTFFNLEPGPVSVEVSRRSTGELVGREIVFIEAGGFTQMVLGPTPLGAAQPESVWSCAGRVAPPTPTVAQSLVRLIFQEGLSDPAPLLVGASVDACAGRDPACTSPLSTAETNTAGEAYLTVPTGAHGFDGFFRVSTASTAPNVLFQYPPIAHLGVPWYGPWVVPLPSEIQELAASDGVTILPGKGTLLVLNANCRYLAHDPFQTSNTTDLVVITAGRAADRQPPNDYYAVSYNLEPGPVTVEVQRRATGELVGRAEVFVEADGWAQMVLGPTPLP